MRLADLEAELDRVLKVDVDGIDPTELLDEVLELEQLRSRLEAASLVRIEAIDRRKAVGEVSSFRNGRRWMTYQTRQSGREIGGRFFLAETLLKVAPEVWEALAAGEISIGHARALARVAERPELVDAFRENVEELLGWARRESWVFFRAFLDAWCLMMDPRDPQDLDDKVLSKRGVAWAQGLDGEVLVELRTNALCWEQAIEASRKVFERMFHEDWEAAKQIAADKGREVTASDLPRTDTQRWHDALFTVIRAGASRINAGDTSDPGVKPDVTVTVDKQTLEDEADRQAGREDTGHRPTSDATAYRCETGNGLRLTPSVALLASISGTVRRVVLNAPSLDLDISKSARLFTGPLRQALIVRDRFCTGKGCETKAFRCEADHIKRKHDGGQTIPTNGNNKCGPCHRDKTRLEALGLWPVPD